MLMATWVSIFFHSIISSSPDWLGLSVLNSTWAFGSHLLSKESIIRLQRLPAAGTISQQRVEPEMSNECWVYMGLYRNILGWSWRIYTYLVFIRLGVRYEFCLEPGWRLPGALAAAQWIPCRAKQVKPLACIISNPRDIIWCFLAWGQKNPSHNRSTKMFRCFEHSLLDQELSVSFHALHLGLRSWAVEPRQAMPRAAFGEIVLEDCWSTSWNHETPWLLQQPSSNIMVILEKNDFTFVPRRHSKVFFYHMGTAEERMRRKAGSNLDVTVAATNWTSNRDVIFCSIFKHTMKVWCWSPKNCIFDVRCWMLADSGTASWCEVGCDACIFSAVGCGAFGNPPEEHVWEIGWSGWNASEISMPFF